MGLLDPMPVLAIMARVTRHIGLGATMSTTYFNPYHIARLLGTLDHLSKGRIAWNVVSSINHLEAKNFGQDRLPDRDTRYDRADEVLEACCKLWESWDADALVMDKERGAFADPSKIRYVNYAGTWIKTRGPLHRAPQPAGPPGDHAGRRVRPRPRIRRPLGRDDLHAPAHQGRHAGVLRRHQEPHDGVRPIAGGMRHPAVAGPDHRQTESIARERQAYVNELVDTELALALVSAHLGVDLSKYPADRPIEEFELEAGARELARGHPAGTKAHGLSLSEAARRFATSELTPQVVGTPQSVADQLADLFQSEACDGFILTPTVFPGTWEQFVRSVVPELQRRGVFRTEYRGRTLRENLRD